MKPFDGQSVPLKGPPVSLEPPDPATPQTRATKTTSGFRRIDGVLPKIPNLDHSTEIRRACDWKWNHRS